MELKNRVIDPKPYAKPFRKPPFRDFSVPSLNDISKMTGFGKNSTSKIQLPPLKRMNMGLSGYDLPVSEETFNDSPLRPVNTFVHLFPNRRSYSNLKRPTLEEPEAPLRIYNKHLDRLSIHREAMIKIKYLLK